MADRINLGDLVRDRLTGFEGIATGKAQYLTGCDRVGVQPRALKPDGGISEPVWFDQPWVEVIERDVVQSAEPRATDAGGPSRGINPGHGL